MTPGQAVADVVASARLAGVELDAEWVGTLRLIAEGKVDADSVIAKLRTTEVATTNDRELAHDRQ